MISMTINLSIGEIDMLLEALEARASRHESMARFSPQSAGPHDRKAEEMRKLRNRLVRLRADAA